ncbi:DUF4232 domain-containing protein [Kibdelosporangium philippinense]|uniref:DUF4232 domain-containing protein n=1 Tax=Kibdelosporangium philippinense TaxID=211113 RepID=A0ABS8ZMK2_9PSEU|nr:DUF4232 domain-containing protein [Kibdelosporangium philippinense]MCE7008969.1 DUF4232 domain-containing protein [Kibdelosporangium philippinense]
MVRNRVIFVGMALLAAGTLAACGGGPTTGQPQQTVTVTQSSTTQPSTPPDQTSTGPERPDHVVRSTNVARCGPTALKGEIVSGDAAAGNRYAKLQVTNTSSKACTLYGYGGLQLTDANGHGQPTKLARKADPGPALVTLEPGQKAFKNLHWGAVPDGTESTTGACEPESKGATVIPPDETQPFTVKFDFGSVCQHGAIDGSAYYK